MEAEQALDRLIEKLQSRLERLRAAEVDEEPNLATWERGRIEGLQVALEDAELLRGITQAVAG